MSIEGRIALTALIGFAAWYFVGLPLIYLPIDRAGELPSKAPILAVLVAFAALH
jgi:hypothetical protein